MRHLEQGRQGAERQMQGSRAGRAEEGRYLEAEYVVVLCDQGAKQDFLLLCCASSACIAIFGPRTETCADRAGSGNMKV